MSLELLKRLSEETDSKIVFLIFDGLGGLDMGKGTALEAAKTPNLDRLAAEGIVGFADPIQPGITPGSGPAHLALFGYNPLQFDIGRGILSALGVGFEIKPGDVAARVNFASIDQDGLVTDRRAGRIPTETCIRLCEKLRAIPLAGVELFVQPEKEHRAAVVLRGKGLSGAVCDTDPQKLGAKPIVPTATKDDPAAEKTAKIVQEFVTKAFNVLKDDHPANAILMRGFDSFEALPTTQEVYRLNPAAIATYPMYKGVSRLVGMTVLDAGDTPATEFDCLEKHWKDHDYFYLHIKKTDSYGEDGNFDGRVHVLEEVDALVPRLVALNPMTILVTGDHSTPAPMKAHSFHPVPVLIRSPLARRDTATAFGETACLTGGLGRVSMEHLMALALAHSGKLQKYGA
ncbi:MAG: 2,3-bisphosphoglycerate-independent phosphoglycerate mutase [bacterium]